MLVRLASLQRSQEVALVAELMMFRRDADGRDVELTSSTVALEVELQRRVEAGLEQMLSVRFLTSEYQTGP